MLWLIKWFFDPAVRPNSRQPELQAVRKYEFVALSYIFKQILPRL